MEQVSVDFLLDRQSPFLLTGILPAATLGAFGLRKMAVLWLLATVLWQTVPLML